MTTARAPMQGDGLWQLRPGDPRRAGAHPPGTIAWSEHLEVWARYDEKWRCGQSAERIAERGGFGFVEASELLGHEPTTWEAREP